MGNQERLPSIAFNNHYKSDLSLQIFPWGALKVPSSSIDRLLEKEQNFGIIKTNRLVSL